MLKIVYPLPVITRRALENGVTNVTDTKAIEADEESVLEVLSNTLELLRWLQGTIYVEKEIDVACDCVLHTIKIIDKEEKYL